MLAGFATAMEALEGDEDEDKDGMGVEMGNGVDDSKQFLLYAGSLRPGKQTHTMTTLTQVHGGGQAG